MSAHSMTTGVHGMPKRHDQELTREGEDVLLLVKREGSLVFFSKELGSGNRIIAKTGGSAP